MILATLADVIEFPLPQRKQVHLSHRMKLSGIGHKCLISLSLATRCHYSPRECTSAWGITSVYFC